MSRPNNQIMPNPNNHELEARLQNLELSDQQSWVIIEHPNSEGKAAQRLSEQSPQPPPAKYASQDLNTQPAKPQHGLQHVGAWADEERLKYEPNNPVNIAANNLENPNQYPIDRYQKQNPGEEPWNAVSFHQK